MCNTCCAELVFYLLSAVNGGLPSKFLIDIINGLFKIRQSDEMRFRAWLTVAIQTNEFPRPNTKQSHKDKFLASIFQSPLDKRTFKKRLKGFLGGKKKKRVVDT